MNKPSIDELHEGAEQLLRMTDIARRDFASYREFLEYFSRIDHIERHHLIIAANFTYGWMPRTLKWKSDEFSKVAEKLNKAKISGSRLTSEDIQLVVSLVDNSMVAVSKLLHFISPDIYVVWDGQISSYLYGRNRQISPPQYLDYLKMVDELTADPEFRTVYSFINQRVVPIQVTKGRAVELIMYGVGEKRRLV
jgi:hypothetical protein